MTVRSLMVSASAIWRLVWPSASRARTSSSRGERPLGGLAVENGGALAGIRPAAAAVQAGHRAPGAGQLRAHRLPGGEPGGAVEVGLGNHEVAAGERQL